MPGSSVPARALAVAAVLVMAAALPGFAQSTSSTPHLYRGVLVLATEPGSAADSAGMARGDIILSVNGRDVNDSAGLAQVVLAQPAGTKVTIRFLHGDIDRTVEVALGTRSGLPFLGVTLEPPGPGPLAAAGAGRSPAATAGRTAAPQEAAAYPVADRVADRVRPDGLAPWLTADAFVAGVALHSPAWRAGLRPGDVITAVEGVQNPSVADLVDAVRGRQPGDAIALTVRGADSQERQVSVELREGPYSSSAWLGVELGPAGYQD